MKPLRRTVGILGGMGPEATLEFMRRLIVSVPARNDADHLHMIVDNNPKVPSRIEALIEKRGEDPAPVLVRMAKGLEAAGADFLVMPCNTAHAYLRHIKSAVAIPVLDMIELSATALATQTRRPGKVGLLASPAVREIGLFVEPFCRAGLEPVFADFAEERTLLEIIKSAKAGRVSQAESAALQGIAVSLAARGADAFLIACTEFSLLRRPQLGDRTVIDSLDILVGETLRAASQSC